MPRRRKCWRWSTGSRGTRVRVWERTPDGPLYIGVPQPGGGYRMIALRHRDRERAKRQAEALASRRGGLVPGGPLTVAALFDLYLRATRGAQKPAHRDEVERAAEMWTRFLGPRFDIRGFGVDHWETFIAQRGAGAIDARGEPVAPEKRRRVRASQLAKDLKVLRAACRRATTRRLEGGGFLLEADPTRGLALPVERNPRRPLAADARISELLAVAGQVTMRVGHGRRARTEPSYLPLLIRLAADTGRRISAILALRWSDWRPDEGSYGRLRWRADADKVGREWWAPVTPAVREALERYRRLRPAVGDVLLFPAPNRPDVPLTRQVATTWLREAEALAKLERLPGGAWHPYRRRWATARKGLPVGDVAAAGGWVDTATLQKCYQLPDDGTMEAVVLHGQARRRGRG